MNYVFGFVTKSHGLLLFDKINNAYTYWHLVRAGHLYLEIFH